MLKALALLVGLGLFGGDDLGQDLKKLQGTWDVLSLEVDATPQPKEKMPKQLIFAGDKLTGLGPDMIVKLDASKSPKWIDLTFKKGDKSYPVQAIYDLKAEELWISLPVAQRGVVFENKRPESFATEGKLQALIKAKRVAKKQ